MNSILIQKKIITITFVFLTGLMYSQINSEFATTYPSPNAFSLGTYGNITTNQYTGVPNINIPLYTIKTPDISIPISLSYHTSNVKVNTHPGWVGSGWTLNSGGAITRIVNGYPDESVLNTDIEIGYFWKGYFLADNSWYNQETLEYYESIYRSNTTSQLIVDIMPDEFQFNFLGYSGSFYLDPYGRWIVVSEQNIVVEFDESDGFLSYSELRPQISDWNVPFDLYNKKHFNYFTLITPDGFRYKFGGKYATEYSKIYGHHSGITANTWYLDQITSPNGRIVDFSYEEGDIISSLSKNYGMSYSTHDSGGGIMTFCESFNFSSSINGHLHFPVYLKKIYTENYYVDFTISDSQELKYDEAYSILSYEWYKHNDIGEFYYYFPDQDISSLKWKKLDKITVREKDQHSNTIKRFDLTYTDSSNERLKLLSVQEVGMKWESGGLPISEDYKNPYLIEYNEEPLPSYCSYQIDHWGFYNGYDISQFPWESMSVDDCMMLPQLCIDNIYDFMYLYRLQREPDDTGLYLNSELIKKITYPTGGTTTFEFEPHDYKKVVDRSDNGYTSLPFLTKGGGVRIKRIVSKPEGNRSVITEYNYLSSGIMQFRHAYNFPGIMNFESGGEIYELDYFSSSSILPISCNSGGVIVGYSKVEETQKDETGEVNGHKHFTFTNFDTDIWGNSHKDESSISYNRPGMEIYLPVTSKKIERGKLTSISYFNKENIIQQKVLYKYTPSSNDYIRKLDCIDFSLCNYEYLPSSYLYGPNTWISLSDLFSYISANKIYSYKYNLKKKIEENYLTNGKVVNEINYNYNNYNLLESNVEYDEKNRELKTTYLYPTDLADYSTSPGPGINLYGKMKNNNMIQYPIEITNFLDNDVIGSDLYEYFEINGKFKKRRKFSIYNIEPLSDFSPYEYRILSPTTAIYEKDSRYVHEFKIEQYDNYGNIVEYCDKFYEDYSVIYGYSSEFPVIVAQNISNQDLQEKVSQLVGDLDIFLEQIGDLTSMDSKLDWKNFNESLRSLLPNTIITYTHKRNFGLTSITNQNAQAEYYEYDISGRLNLIKDQDGNIIKTYEYNFKQD